MTPAVTARTRIHLFAVGAHTAIPTTIQGVPQDLTEIPQAACTACNGTVWYRVEGTEALFCLHCVPRKQPSYVGCYVYHSGGGVRRK